MALHLVERQFVPALHQELLVVIERVGRPSNSLNKRVTALMRFSSVRFFRRSSRHLIPACDEKVVISKRTHYRRLARIIVATKFFPNKKACNLFRINKEQR
jgi:hypothetical protein